MNSAHSCPALLIAAPASGQGKTTVTAALARLHARQGKRVRVFKCGPDFLDPMILARASGAPVYQLDLWMVGEAESRRLLWEAAGDADLILIEGVMGLFDGTPSAADLARHFGVPVLAVVDASAMAGTFGALAYGLRHYRPGLPWAGVLANRVGSARHADMLRDGLQDADDWMGALMRVQPGNAPLAAKAGAALLPERHLGLVAAHELDDSLQRLDAAADALAATPLGQMTLEDLQRFPWLHDSLRSSKWQQWLAACNATHLAGPSHMKLQGTEITLAAAVAGAGIAMGHDVLVAHDVAEGRLVEAWPFHVPMAAGYHLLLPANGRGNEDARAVADWLLREAGAFTRSAPRAAPG